MFCLKVIFFVAALGVVNAAITVNIYDDDRKDVTTVKEDYQEAHGCIEQVCDELCRSLNFPGGVCDNGRCICNHMKPTDEVDKTLHLERSLQEARSCYNQACDQLCRRLKFPGGACIYGRCKCDNFIQSELVIEYVKDLGSCNWRACDDELCRRIGFAGGVCVGNNCKCDNFRLNNNVIDEAKTFQGCDVVACNDMCNRMNYIGGMCIDGSCYCY